MRFRATLSNVVCIAKTLEALEKLGQTCVLHLQPTAISFYMNHEMSNAGPAFADLKVEPMCEDYKIESKSNNEILLLVNIANLCRAIKSGERAMKIVIKLTKKNSRAYLTFQITENVVITQEVPVALKSAKSISDYREPDIPRPEVQLRMPGMASLKSVIERMASVSEQLTIEASTDGRMEFSVETDMVTIRTHYKCTSPAGQSEEDISAPTTAKTTMKIKYFSKVMGCRSLPAHYFLGCLVEDHAFVLYCSLTGGQGNVTYYVPLLASDG